MLARPAVRCTALQTCLAAVAVLALSACMIDIREPAADSIITLPSSTSMTKVVVTGNSSYTGLKVTVDGIDFSSQMVHKGSDRHEGDLSLAPGRHTIFASADMYLWTYQTRSTDTKTCCVVVSGPVGGPPTSGVPTKITFAKKDDKSWASLNDANLSFASDSGLDTTQWVFTPIIPGIANTDVTIASIKFPCKCLSSPDNNQDSQIALAICDPTDTRQHWWGIRMQMIGGKGFYRFENRFLRNNGMISHRCLTEGSGNKVIQGACIDADNQLWAVKTTTTTTTGFEVGPNPW